MEPFVKPLIWENSKLFVIDQTLLPEKEVYIELASLQSVFEAIKTLKVRGAPLIGCCAAFGMVVGLMENKEKVRENGMKTVAEIGNYLKSSRPTAVNLEWAVNEVIQKIEGLDFSNVDLVIKKAEEEALKIFNDDLEMCRKIGEFGSELIEDGDVILTHCNAGGLATSGYGTALSPMFFAKNQNKNFKVYVDETRPLLQGARLTSYELLKAGIDAVLITDSMSASSIKNKGIKKVIVGADRIASNGDTANKIGTLALAIICNFYNIPLYIAAPSSTFDFSLKNGGEIPIEERNPDEVKFFRGVQTAPKNVGVYNPAFDVTPFSLINAFITEKGILHPPYENSFKVLRK